MTTERISEFNEHRAAVLEAHLKRDKTYQAKRRARRIGILTGLVKVSAATFAMLALMKSLMLATHDGAEYAQIIAPAIAGLDAAHPVAKALMPDSLTMTVAEALRPVLGNAGEDLAFGPPMPPGMADPAVTPGG